MNRVVRAAAAAAVAAGGSGTIGCVHGNGPSDSAMGGGAVYRQFVDTCYPERYNMTARYETLAPFAAQVNNGNVLNQTIWNWYFEPGTDVLTPAGHMKLDSLAQTRPAPDARIYLQAARDVAVTTENVDRAGQARENLTTRRAAAIQRYMGTQPVIGGNAVAYEIYVHDPVTLGMPADFAAYAFRSQFRGYRGGIGGQQGAINATGGGAAPASGMGGGGGGTSGPSAGPSAPGPNPNAGNPAPGM
ncbi:MAG TPA: hypothetical protein VN641_05725 [Urbifossiella sp.]|nr:hypothetical protein [Urbifossiella sp.]